MESEINILKKSMINLIDRVSTLERESDHWAKAHVKLQQQHIRLQDNFNSYLYDVRREKKQLLDNLKENHMERKMHPEIINSLAPNS